MKRKMRGILDNRPAEVITTGRRRVKVGWAGFVVFRFLDGDMKTITMSSAQSVKRFQVKPVKG